MAQEPALSRRHLLSEVSEDHQASSRREPAIVFVPVLRTSRTPDARHDLRGFGNVAQTLVSRNLLDGLDAMRHQRQATRARTWRHVQNRMANVQSDSFVARRRRRSKTLRQG